MVDALLVMLVAIPVGIQLLLAAFTYYDATDIGMNARKWTLIVGLIPAYGLILYLLTRSERDYDPDEDPHRERAFEIHPSRAGESPGPAERRPEGARDRSTDDANTGDRSSEEERSGGVRGADDPDDRI